MRPINLFLKLLITILTISQIDCSPEESEKNRITQMILTQSQQQHLPIFKPLPVYSTTNTDVCSTPQNYLIKVFMYLNVQHVAIGLGSCGVKILRIDDPTNPTQVFYNSFNNISGRVNGLTLDTSRNLLWVVHSSNNVYTIDISQAPFQYAFAFESSNQIQPYFVDFIPGVQNTILLLCFSEIQVFTSPSTTQTGNRSLNDPTTFSLYRRMVIPNSNNPIRIQFSASMKLFFLGSYPLGALLYQITNTADKDFNLNLLYTFKPRWNNLAWFQLVESRNIFYLQLEQFGVYSYDMTLCQQNINVANCSPALQYFYNQKSKSGQFVINKDNTFLFTEYRAFGFFIFDISTTKITNFQTISRFNAGDSQQIALSEDETLLFCTTQFEFLIYQKTSAIQNLNKPNILQNIVQAIEYDNYRFEPKPYGSDPHCFLDTKRQIYYLSRQAYGLEVFSLTAPGVMIQIAYIDKNVVAGELTSEFVMFQDNTIMYIPQGSAGLSVIDFSTPSSPVYIQKHLMFGYSTLYSSTIQCNTAQTICAMGEQYIGILVLDTSDYKNPKLVSTFTTNAFSITQAFALGSFLHKSNVLLASVQYWGFLIIDITNPSQPKQLSAYYNNESYFSISTSDDQYCLVSASYKGMQIFDISDLTNPILLATVPLYGVAYRIHLLSNEAYALVTCFENPGVFLVDISNRQKPFLVQQFRDQKGYGFFDMCFDQYETQGYLTSGDPALFFKLKSNIFIHTEIYEIVNQAGTNQQIFKSIDSSTALLVGQAVTMYVIPIWPYSQIQVKRAQIYIDYLLQPLYPWMVFSPDLSTLSLTISKDSLNIDQQGNYVQSTQTVVFQAYQQLNNTSFVNTALGIDAAHSASIVTSLQSLGILDFIMMPIVDFNTYTVINLPFSTIYDPTVYTFTQDQQIQMLNFIRYTIQSSIALYPIDFTVQPSLTFNSNAQVGNYVYSYSGSVTMYISVVNKELGVFVSINYPGVLTVLSSQSDEIKLEGEIDKINQILLDGIKFHPFQSDYLDIQFKVLLQDGINYDQTQTLTYQQLPFLELLHQVTNSSRVTLQDDFIQKIGDSSIYITQRFQYTISSDIFSGDKDTPITYTAQMLGDEGNYINIPFDFWLEFSATDRMFSGEPSEKQFNTRIHLLVNVTDGYTYTTQTFYIDINKVPILYILQIMVQILGPLLGLFGIWKYKYVVYNTINKKYYTFSPEIIPYGKPYSKRILLNYNNLSEAEIIFAFFKSIMSNKEINDQIYQMYSLSRMAKVSQPLQEENKFITFSLNNLNYEAVKPLSQLQQKQQASMGTSSNNPSYGLILSSTQRKKSREIDTSLKDINNHSNIYGSTNNKLFTPKLRLAQVENVYNNQLQLVSDRISYDTPKTINEEEPEFSLCQPKFCKGDKQTQKTKNMTTNNKNDDLANSKGFETIEGRNQRTKSQFTKLKSKLLSQITKISLMEKSIMEKSQKLPLKESSKNKCKCNLFDLEGRIDYNSIVKLIVAENQQKNVLSLYFIAQLQKEQGLVRQTFEGFVAEHILYQDQLSYGIFFNLYKICTENKENLGIDLDWYRYYCTISSDLDNICSNPVPKIIFDDIELNRNIKEQLFHNDIEILSSNDQVPYSLNLIKETIKAMACGFISDSSKFTLRSTGESIKTKIHKIKQITSYQKRKEAHMISSHDSLKNKIINSIKVKFRRQLIEKPLVDNNKLPSWVKSVDIINSNLLILGQPEKKDIGSHYIKILADGNYILRLFEIKIIGDQDDHIPSIEVKQQKHILTSLAQNPSNIQREGLKKKSSKIDLQTPTQEDMINEGKQQIYQTLSCERLQSVFDGIGEERKQHQNDYLY